jgi:hypothetical protein
MGRDTFKVGPPICIEPRKFDNIVVDSTLYLVHLILDKNVIEKKSNRKQKKEHPVYIVMTGLKILSAEFFELRPNIAGMHRGRARPQATGPILNKSVNSCVHAAHETFR